VRGERGNLSTGAIHMKQIGVTGTSVPPSQVTDVSGQSGEVGVNAV